MKLAFCQYAMKRGQIEENIGRVRGLLEEAAHGGSDLFVLPEFWAMGWDLEQVEHHAHAMDEGVFRQMSDWAREFGVGVVGTHACRTDDGITNRQALYGPDGRLLAHYDKMHCFPLMDEERYITPGHSLTVADTPWGLLGMATCFDLRFPELFRQLALKHARLILVPAYWPSPRLHHWQWLLKVRAVENQLFVAGVNRASGQGKTRFGYSAVVTPDGSAVAGAGESEALMLIDIDLAEVEAHRRDFPALAGRRPGLYGEF